MNFTLSATYGKTRNARKYQTKDDMSPAEGLWIGVVISAACWAAIAALIWSLCK